MDAITLTALERGLSMSDVKSMQLGQIVDFCIEHQKRQERAEAEMNKQKKRGNIRKATQADIDAFFG